MEDGRARAQLVAAVRAGPVRLDRRDLVELAKVARAVRRRLPHAPALRERRRSIESLDEVFTIAERANIPAEIWHLKTAYKANWGRMPEVLRRIEEARARGLDVTANQYPYTRASNDLDSCLPLWVREGGDDQMIARLKDPALRERIKTEMDDPNATGWENQWYGSGGGDGVMVSSVLNADLRKYEGMTLTQIGQAMGKDPRDALMDLVIADRGQTACIISDHDGGRRADGARAPAGLHRHRLGREGRGRPARRSRSRTRAPGARSRGSSASTCATRSC